jgi:hypothetical protein
LSRLSGKPPILGRLLCFLVGRTIIARLFYEFAMIKIERTVRVLVGSGVLCLQCKWRLAARMTIAPRRVFKRSNRLEKARLLSLCKAQAMFW